METSSPIILVVEDNEHDSIILEKALAQANCDYRVETVRDAEAAIQYLCGTGAYADRELFPFPSLLILDLGLPRVSGREVLDWIKQNPGRRRLLVILLSGINAPMESGEVLESHGKVTILNAQFLKPPSAEMVGTIISLFVQWLGQNPPER